MRAQQSSSLGICNFTHTCLIKTRLLHICRKKNYQQQNSPIIRISQWERSRGAKTEVSRKRLSTKWHVHLCDQMCWLWFPSRILQIPQLIYGCALPLYTKMPLSLTNLVWPDQSYFFPEAGPITLSITSLSVGEDCFFQRLICCFNFISLSCVIKFYHAEKIVITLKLKTTELFLTSFVCFNKKQKTALSSSLSGFRNGAESCFLGKGNWRHPQASQLPCFGGNTLWGCPFTCLGFWCDFPPCPGAGVGRYVSVRDLSSRSLLCLPFGSVPPGLRQVALSQVVLGGTAIRNKR